VRQRQEASRTQVGWKQLVRTS